MKKHFGCPVQATINTVSGKWKVLAIWHLGFGAKRFADLRKLLPGVSAKVLTSQLRALERDGVVRREFKRSSPPQTSYRLTKAGDDLLDPLTELCHWGTRNLGVPPNLPRYPKASKK